MISALLTFVLASVPTTSHATTSEAPERPAVSARGHSGKLRAIYADAGEKLDHAFEGGAARELLAAKWRSVSGKVQPATDLTAPSDAGVWSLEHERAEAAAHSDLSVITRVPLTERRNGKLNGYRLGTWPAERAGRKGRYAPPAAFIEVTPENQDVFVSEHFQLRQFLTKNQKDVWPKYLALDLRLVDKLELVIQELNAMGHRAGRLHVMSGFRTPQYNGPGGKGRAKFSRHTYGDAADIWVDEDGDGSMDDLNGDGRVDVRDCEVILAAVDRVEKKYPELIGGAGVYRANRSHGPFVHIDARGNDARWAKR